jgi:hypothetical protein
MTRSDISADKAGLLSTVLEALFYGTLRGRSPEYWPQTLIFQQGSQY